ncbi:hypothetical protein Gotur_025937 [Gossypium turneri]
MCITGMSEQWKRVDIFALSIYGLVIFPKVLGHVDEVVSDLFDRLDKGVTPVPAILAETFRTFKRMTLNGKLLGWCPMRSYIGVETSTGSLYLEFGELSDIPLYLY